MTKQANSVFATLSTINLNDKVEKKSNLTYLSWTYAWSEVKKHYPDANYEVVFFDDLPYSHDYKTGYMVFTKVTIEGQTHMMWLPVMDGANKAMKDTEYSYATRYGDKTVEAATMFDINKAIMRCLVKNLAMFGLGIYIYAGEDLPEGETAAPVIASKPKTVAKTTDTSLLPLEKGDSNWAKVSAYVSDNKTTGIEAILQQLGRKYSISAATKKELAKIISNG
jgi:hypothetical protein